MFEEIHELDLIEGELYLIINPVFEIRIEKAKMICYTRTRYNHHYGIQYDSDIDGLNTIILESTIFYRYISIQEYKKKVREKYNDTCLDIILKRLVDESFDW
jgi:hypothetical protein